MKRNTLIIIGLFFALQVSSQTYFPFPTDTAQWNCVIESYPRSENQYYYNYQYRIQGEILIDSTLYNKVYLYEAGTYTIYIGGIREDSNKNIYFYPNSAGLPNYAGSTFPNNTEEHLLYTFDSLTPGMVLPINSDNDDITVVAIDSILLDNSYRKRYKIKQDWLGTNYWIEGIGSTKDLFAPYSQEHEYYLYTLCFTDSTTYYINSPGAPTCIYPPPVSIINQKSKNILIYPIPAGTEICIGFSNTEKYDLVSIYDLSGHLMLKDIVTNNPLIINIDKFRPGVYLIELTNKKERLYRKFLKR